MACLNTLGNILFKIYILDQFQLHYNLINVLTKSLKADWLLMIGKLRSNGERYGNLKLATISLSANFQAQTRHYSADIRIISKSAPLVIGLLQHEI